jgi:hypothetical protein
MKTEEQDSTGDNWLGATPIMMVREPIDYEFRIIAASGEEVARIDKDGIFRCRVDPTDENARKFVEAIESVTGRRLAGVAVT